MKILVIGNGFDLDHGLPTGYMDFLNFCNSVSNLEDSKYSGHKRLKSLQKKYIKLLKDEEKTLKPFLNCIKDNCLLNYFNSRIKSQGKNWIDFEREIKGIVAEFKIVEAYLKKSDITSYPTPEEHRIHQIVSALGLSDMDRTHWDEKSLSAIYEMLCKSLESFSIALEIYIARFINKTAIKGISPDIIDFNANRVLNFNYSKTYRRIYFEGSWNESVDYVHGAAVENVGNTAHIILGITSEDETVGGYVEFEKYYQRITKRTGNDYKNWLQTPLKKNESFDIMFFGHSLDSSDSDIIKDLICNENSFVSIYYHDESAFKQIVSNLIEIIGKEKIISYVSGSNPKLKFVKQRPHCNDNTGGREISRDTRRIYNICYLKKKSMETLLEKIKKKISERDTNYFYSQRKVITLLDALCTNKIELAPKEDFLSICESLDFEISSPGKLKYFIEDDWFEYYPWDDQGPCQPQIAWLIEAVNKSNEERLNIQQSLKYAVQIHKMKTSDEMKQAFVSRLYEDEAGDDYWDEFNEVVRLMAGNQIFEDMISGVEQDEHPLYVKVKLKRFIYMYNEYLYNKQMDESLDGIDEDF